LILFTIPFGTFGRLETLIDISNRRKDLNQIAFGRQTNILAMFVTRDEDSCLETSIERVRDGSWLKNTMKSRNPLSRNPMLTFICFGDAYLWDCLERIRDDVALPTCLRRAPVSGIVVKAQYEC
jgi:hypothetical protein